MIRYKLTERPPKWPFAAWKPREMFVILRATHKHDFAKLEFEGDPHLLFTLAPNVEFMARPRDPGEYWTDPRELAVTMRQAPMNQYDVELIEGKEIYDRED